MKEINKVLDTGEKVLWEEGPKFWQFIFGAVTGSFIFGIFWLGIILFIFRSETQPFPLVLLPHFWVGIALTIGPLVYSLLVFKHTYYTITDKRVIIQSGWIGRDFYTIDFDQITNSEVNVGLVDKLFNQNTGSILISTAGTFVATKNGPQAKPYNLRSIFNPYEVFKLLKKTSHDVKTDIQYPNKMRPSENPGYNTSYTGSDTQNK